jgi:hypothetical protein
MTWSKLSTAIKGELPIIARQTKEAGEVKKKVGCDAY